jgi:hypothetical protein
MAPQDEDRWRGWEPTRGDRDWYGSGREGRSDWEGSWSGGRGSREPEYERYSTREGPYDRFREDYPRGYRGEGMGNWYGAGTYGFTGFGAARVSRGYAGRGPKGYRRSDERIREDVSDRLTWNAEVDASDIEVRVIDGEVTLTGVVEDRRAKRLAEDLAEDVFGVQDIHNQLKVRHGFLAGLTGEKADEREVAVTSGRDRTETSQKETRSGASVSRSGRT